MEYRMKIVVFTLAAWCLKTGILMVGLGILLYDGTLRF
jgi:hypothetical protein